MSAQLGATLDHQPIEAPKATYFDAERGAWIVSRYAEVAEALREPRLWPVGTRGQDQSADRDEGGKFTLRRDFEQAFCASNMAGWRAQSEAIAHGALEQLTAGRPVDLLGEFAAPVCLAVAMRILGADPTSGPRLSMLGAQVFGSLGSPEGSPLRAESAAATAELDEIFRRSAVPLRSQSFVGMTQTLPRVLAGGWATLLQHPSEISRLRAEPHLMAGAVEELLRCAPIVRMVSRRAMEEVEINGLRIPQGAQVNLMLASANRDPEQFHDPEALDISRRPAHQLALGLGRDSCVGAVVVRMVHAVATGALVGREITPTGPVEWHCRSVFSWPASVSVMLGAGD